MEYNWNEDGRPMHGWCPADAQPTLDRQLADGTTVIRDPGGDSRGRHKPDESVVNQNTEHLFAPYTQKQSPTRR